MSDWLTYPQENKYETQIVGEISSSATTPFNITVKTAPGFTLGAGESVYAVLEPGTSKEEVIEIDDISSTTLQVATRGLASANGGADSTTSHAGGSTLIFSDNWQTFDDIATAIASKLDATGEDVASFDLTVTGTDFRIREDGGDMKFTDDSQAEVSLATLAAAAGVDDKVKVSNADTTSDYLGDKIVATNGVKESITSPAGDEKLQLEIDTTTLPANLDEANTFFGLTDATGTEMETLTDEGDASYLHFHSLMDNARLDTKEDYYVVTDSEDNATGTVTRTNSIYANLVTGAVNNQYAGLRLLTQSGNTTVSVHDQNPEFYTVMFLSSAAAQDGFVGFVNTTFIGTSLEDHIMTLDHFGIIIEDNKFYVSVADGTTQTVTDTGLTISANTDYTLYGTFDGTTAKLFIDGTQYGGDITTNVPDSNLVQFWAGIIADATAASKTMYVKKISRARWDKQ